MPEQFVPLRSLLQGGYNVLISFRHGQAGNWNADYPPPLRKISRYINSLVSMVTKGSSFGKVIVGGCLVAVHWLASARMPSTKFDRFAFALYFSSNKLVDLFVQPISILGGGLNSKAHFGYDGFLMPALEVFLDMGRDVLERMEKSVAALNVFVSSES